MGKRYEISDEQWEKIKDLLPGREGHVGVTAQDNRRFINGVLWILRSGAPWRDLPERYGDWKNTHRRFSRWAQTKVWERIFQVLVQDEDNEYLMIDSTIVRAHQHAAGARGKKKTRLWGVPGGD
jgi:putative transposase